MCQRRQKSMRLSGEVGAVEVFGEAEAHEQADAERDVGVAGEVEVELEGVAVDAGQDLETAVEGGGVEDAGDEVFGEEVGDEELLDQADADEEERAAGEVGGERARAAGAA